MWLSVYLPQIQREKVSENMSAISKCVCKWGALTSPWENKSGLFEGRSKQVCVCVCVSLFVSVRELLIYSNSINSFQFVFTAHITVCMYKCLVRLERYIKPKCLHIHLNKAHWDGLRVIVSVYSHRLWWNVLGNLYENYFKVELQRLQRVIWFHIVTYFFGFMYKYEMLNN